MRLDLRTSLPSLALLTLAACGPSRLSDADVTRLCELSVECAGGAISQASCETTVTAQRDAANATGCGGQFGAVARCAIRADECVASGVPAGCEDEQMRLVTCQSRPRDTGPGVDAGRIEGVDTGPLVFPDTGLECVPAAEEYGFTYCSDGCDNDDNGAFDCNDEACCGSVECPSGTVCGGGSCTTIEEVDSTYCTDGCDNDADGVYDCDDSGCCASLSGECSTSTLCGSATASDTARTTNGFLEVYYMGEWRGVCDDSFDTTDADVACRMLGRSGAETFSTTLSCGGSSAFWLDDLDCTGSESSLAECTHPGWGEHNCSDGECLTVICF